MLPKTIKGAIFDLDGTLLDSLDSWSEVDRRFFGRRGIPMPADYFDCIKTLDLKDAAVYTKERFSLPEEPPCLVEEWRALIREEYAERIVLRPYVKELLSFLSARGTGLAVATSSAPDLFLPALARNGIDGYFSAFVTTRDVARGKDSPDVYLEAAIRLGVPPEECAVFEDILPGVKSAKAGGFFTVGVAEPHSARDREEIANSCDLFLSSYSELLGMH